GMLGMHGTYEANWAMHDCDVMICIGARFDDRVTGNIDKFSPNSKKIHIDIDASSINKNIQIDLPIISDASRAIQSMMDVWNKKGYKANEAALKQWWKQIDTWRAKNCLAYKKDTKIIKPQYALERLRHFVEKHQEKTKQDVYFTTEVGQHQMWAAQFLPIDEPNHWMTSGGLGTMGYGLPSAVGVQRAHPDSHVICIAGDASIQMNIQELGTAIQHNLPVKIFILNNDCLGMVRQWQELLHDKRYSETICECKPDIVALAEAYGGVGLRATNIDELDNVIENMLASDRMTLVDIYVDPEENCFPMIPSGKAHNDMIFSPDIEKFNKKLV
ncbi:MAG: acetolactate synthase 3 large subunit, partial [Alphaproteobacteria bacterium]|nr:acetolactate synthase 3 large subunit [Alphaproteobacteria bacterium]